MLCKKSHVHVNMIIGVPAIKISNWRCNNTDIGISISGISTDIKPHSRVSAAKKAMWHTSLLFTGTANSPFSTPHISITTGSISIIFTYFMPSIYATIHTKFETVVCEMCS